VPLPSSPGDPTREGAEARIAESTPPPVRRPVAPTPVPGHDDHGTLGSELRHHLPYSVLSIVGAMVVIGVLTLLLKAAQLHGLFHVFHPTHLLLSATATTAMFWIHERRILKAVAIGFLASLPVCSLSDILIPYLGGLILDQSMELHLCALEEPLVVYPFVFVGIATGIIAGEHVHRSTLYSHAGHVAVSSMASILYLVGYGISSWTHWIGAILLILLVAVMIPCVLSDIVLPLLFVTDKRCRHIRDLDAI